MVIQRLQSLFLLIAFVALVLSAIFPVYFLVGYEQVIYDGPGSGMPEAMSVFSKPCAHWPGISLFALTIIDAIISIVAIFLFKNFRKQKRTIKIAIWLSLLLVIGVGVYGYLDPLGGNEEFTTAGIIFRLALVPLALVFQIWALRRVKADERLLRSADRIR